jgi:hypothetical protein
MIYKRENLSIVMTTQMINTLMDIHEREILGTRPVDAALCPSMGALTNRGFLATKMHSDCTGKRYLAAHITWQGKEFLKSL